MGGPGSGRKGGSGAKKSSTPKTKVVQVQKPPKTADMERGVTYTWKTKSGNTRSSTFGATRPPTELEKKRAEAWKKGAEEPFRKAVAANKKAKKQKK